MNTKTFLALVLLVAPSNCISAGELTIPSSSIGGGGSSTGGSFSVSGFLSTIAIVSTADAPKLTLKRSASGYEVSWPLPADGFVLQETPSLASTGAIAWANSSVSFTEEEGRRTVILPANGPVRYFRLIKALP